MRSLFYSILEEGVWVVWGGRRKGGRGPGLVGLARPYNPWVIGQGQLGILGTRTRVKLQRKTCKQAISPRARQAAKQQRLWQRDGRGGVAVHAGTRSLA